MEAEELERRATRTLVLEEIEDFEHKLGWKMRKNLGASLRSPPVDYVLGQLAIGLSI